MNMVGQFGRSYIVACCLLKDEKTASYELALRSFIKLFGTSMPVVNVIITDQEKSLMNAISTYFPTSNHQLCVWHLAKNVKKHLNEDPLTWGRFMGFIHSSTEQAAEEILEEMVDSRNCTSQESAYLRRVCGLKERFVEAWICRHRNLGIRSTQRAESMNRAFKRQLQSYAPLVDLFRVLQSMTEAHMETHSLLELQAQDRPKVYRPLISHLSGQVSSYILGLVEGECAKLVHTFIGRSEDDDDEYVTFSDSYKYSWQNGCNCPFAIQHVAPCVHYLKAEGECQLRLFHSAWIIHGEPVTHPAILYGARQEVLLSPADKVMDELNDTVSYIQRRLFEMEPGVALSFAKKFKDMIDRKDLNAPVNVQDPPISKPRGRPRKPSKNTFNGGQDVA